MLPKKSAVPRRPAADRTDIDVGWMDIKSRVNREVLARFWESPGVRFPRGYPPSTAVAGKGTTRGRRASVSRHFQVREACRPHLVGTHQERRRNGQVECACCIQVNDEFELDGLLNRQLSRLCATQNFVNERDDMAVTEQKPRSISQQPSLLGSLPPLAVDRRQARGAQALYNQMTSGEQ